MTCLYRWKEIAILALAVLATAGQAQARTAPAFIPMGAEADAPAGFMELCGRERALCDAGNPARFNNAATSPSAASPAIADLSTWTTGGILSSQSDHGSDRTSTGSSSPAQIAQPAPDRLRKRMLERVNGEVNHMIAQRTDMDIFGVDEHWARPGMTPGAMGDCEDIALEKRMRLIAAGFAPADLFFAVVFSRGTGLHTVLIARTGDGDAVLDNLTGRILPWGQADYSWLRIQAPGNPYSWTRVGQS